MENDNKTQQDKIKELVRTIEDMHLEEPYKSATYNAMLARLLGNVTASQDTKPDEPRKKKAASIKTGRGNKSEVVMFLG